MISRIFLFPGFLVLCIQACCWCCICVVDWKKKKKAFSECGARNPIKTKLLLSLSGGPFGYNEVAMIPAGATHIRVTDNSRNYLGKNPSTEPLFLPVSLLHTPGLLCV